MNDVAPLEGTVIPAPKHGSEINRVTVTQLGESGISSMTYETGRKLCRVHGWIEWGGIIGSIDWHMEHDGCWKEEEHGGGK